MVDVRDIKVGDILRSASGREVRVLKVEKCAILAKPTDGKVWYKGSDGREIMQAWFSPDRYFHIKK